MFYIVDKQNFLALNFGGLKFPYLVFVHPTDKNATV